MEGVIIIQSLLLISAIILIILNKKLKFFRFKKESWFFDILVPVFVSFGLLLLHFTQYMSTYSNLLLIYMAPISEEIIFRGALLGLPLIFLKESKRNHPGLVFLFILFSSFIFTISHGDFNQTRMIFGLVMGIMFVLYKKNILPCIIAHYINNATLLLSV